MRLTNKLGIFAIVILMILGFSSNLKAQYCDANTVQQNGEYISGVKFNTIDNQKNGISATIQDWTNLSTDVNPGSSYDITVTNGATWSGDKVYLWIDFNNDYVFSTTTEEYRLSTSDGANTFKGSIFISITLLPDIKKSISCS